MEKTILVAPDGGYGWVIVLASAMNNFITIPLIQNFGMLFKDKFSALGISATQASLIINVNSAFGMLMGLINGSLLNKFGYRKMSLLAASLVMVGVISTAFANSFGTILLTYGFMTSFGNGMNMSSYSLAINTYFKEKRSKAISLSMTVTALGPIIMPQVINLLLSNYSIEGATLILGGIFAHGFFTALLLQPVKWHMKKKVVPDIKDDTIIEEDEEKQDEQPVDNQAQRLPLVRSMSQVEPPKRNSRFRRKDSTITISYEQETAGIMGMDSVLGGSMISLQEPAAPVRRPSMAATKTTWWKSTSTVNLDSSVNIFEDKLKNSQVESSEKIEEKVEKKPLWKKICSQIVQTLDLTLLKDPIYISIMIGMSLAIFAELTFSVLTAFILSDYGLTTSEIATFLSCLGVADITLRFSAPYIGDYFKYPPRVLYVVTLITLIITRFALTVSTNYKYLLGVAVALGCAKGVRTVYMSLVIPTYVPLERLAAASGMQMMVNGLCILIGGPIIGFVRDVTGSYTISIFIMNAVTFSTILLWSVEYLVRKYRRKNKTKTKDEISDEKV